MSSTLNITADKITFLRSQAHADNFTEDFCLSLLIRLDEGRALSPKQAALLDKLVARASAPKPAPGAFVGAVGERITFQATVTFKKVFDSAYGPRHMNVLTDAAGHKLVWWGSRAVEANGDVVVMTATVKAHEAHRGVNQTTLSRPRWEIVACGVAA
ncbi:MAG: hypothetical protein EOO40_00415 [Deltaproteobacteria bacterium]|nr:MAG: hypothetical protein EOO40_00415 [Deltaproteobacteria bacterium]